MTIERPMFPSRAESVDSFLTNSGTQQPETGERASESPGVGPSSASVLAFPGRPPVIAGTAATMAEIEQASKILNLGVTFAVSCAGAGEVGFKIDHTGDGHIAGSGGTVGEKHWRAAERSLRALIKLMQSGPQPSTVELWALASVAKEILVEAEENHFDFMREKLDPRFLKEFAELIERLCKAQYDREWKANLRAGREDTLEPAP